MWLKSAAFVTLLVVIVSIASVCGKEENNQKQEEEEQEELQQSPSVMVDSQKVINNIAQEFVCFSAKPRTVFEDALNPISETTFKMAKQLSPSYLKVYADSSQMELQMEAFSVREEQSELIQITPNGWRAFDKWAQEAGMVPIFVLDYSGDSWKPNSALKVLMVANSLGITNCLWQLGTGNITNAVKYVEDLRAFRAITKAFKYKGVVACDVDPMTVGLDQTRYFNLNVEELADAVSVTYEQKQNQKQLNEFVLQREAYVRGPMRSQLPVWLDVKAPSAKVPSSESCNENCLQEGLQYATLLGDAARNGFNTVFKTLSRQEVQSYSLTYVIGLLHKRTIGTKVFEVSQIYEQNLKIYAYCSCNGNGSLSLMAVNQQSEDLQFEMQLATKQQSAEVQQYAITVAEEVIQLNDRPFHYDSQLKPLAKTRSISKGLQLLIPGRAIVFWVIPNLNLRQCYEDYQNLQEKFFRTVSVQENSVDQLLQELIAERAEQQQQEQEKLEQKNRQKRSVSTDQLEGEVGISKTKPKTKEQRGVKAKGNRSPRQTLNYRRKERTVRLKEKRAERRHLKQQRRPLRERGKRQSRKHNRCDNPSKITPSNKKTKRSSLAEAVNQPPTFGDSYEDQINRSSFPQGDVHLVISKGIQEDDPLSVEHVPMKESLKKRQKKIQQKNPAVEKDLRFFVPEVALIKDQGIPRPELVAAESIHHEILLNEPEQNTSQLKSLSIDPNLVQVRDIQEEIRAGAPIVKRESLEADEQTDLRAERDNAAEEVVDEEEQQSSTSASGEDIGPADHSLGDSPEVDRSVIFSDEDDSEDSSDAYDDLDRSKRSLPSMELTKPEASSSNNTKWAERLQDLIKSYGNLSKSEARVKRNALLHPRSWESRANLLRQQRTSGEESKENMILGDADAMREVRKIREDLLVTEMDEQITTEVNRRPTTVSKENDSDRLTVMTMRSVAKFVRSMSDEFNRMLSRWLPKSKEKLSA